MDSRVREVWEYIKNKDSIFFTRDEIIEQLAIRPGIASYALGELHAAGKIEKYTNHYWKRLINFKHAEVVTINGLVVIYKIDGRKYMGDSNFSEILNLNAGDKIDITEERFRQLKKLDDKEET